MTTPMISILNLFLFRSSHVNARLSHKPVSHPIREKMSEYNRPDGSDDGAHDEAVEWGAAVLLLGRVVSGGHRGALTSDE